MASDLEREYQDARAALKARQYDHAAELLREILLADENYKDASRLLAQAVRLKRRRWYKAPWVWGSLAAAGLIGLGLFYAPRVRNLYARPDERATERPTGTASPTAVWTATPTLPSAPTPIPLAWKRISIGQEFARDIVSGFEIDPNDPEVLYVRMEHAGYFKSIDGGTSWQPTRWEDASADIKSGLTVYRKEIEVHLQGAELAPFVVSHVGPDAKERIYKVDESHVEPSWSASEDGGVTWRIAAPIGKPKSIAIGFDARGWFYASCASLLCKYSPDGSQHVTLGAPGIGTFTIIAILATDPNTIYVAGDGLSVSHDGGQTWTKLNNGLGSVMLQIAAGSGTSPLLYVQSGQCSDDLRNDKAGLPLYVSTDGGLGWTLSLEAGCFLIKDADQMTLYRVGRCADCSSSKGWIWQTQDGGQSWAKVASPGAPLALAADPSKPGFLYASMLIGYQPLANYQGLMTRQKLYYSEDQGRSWKATSSAQRLVRCKGLGPQSMDPGRPQYLDTNWPMAIDPRDSNHVLYVVRGVLFESHDGCIRDARIFNDSPPGIMNSIAVDPNHPATLYAGTDRGAFISVNDGKAWGQIQDGLLGVAAVYSIAVDQDSNVYAATPYGIFKLDGK